MPLNNFEYWIDANLPPQLADWLNEKFSVQAFSLKELGMLKTADKEIYNLASKKNIIILTKDEDFAELLRLNGAPPKVIWVTVGNISNEQLKIIILNCFERAVQQLETENNLVEITTSI